MRDDLKALLRRLLAAPAPSGYEEPAAVVWHEAAAAFADVRRDALGNALATVNPDGAPHVALIAHLDEIGLIVTEVDEGSGMLRFDAIGSWDPSVVVAQRVIVVTRDGEVPGVVGRRAWHLLDEEELRRVAPLDSLWIDVGARDADEARSIVRPGDPIVLDGPPLELRNGRLASRALDNRVGALVVLEAARRALEAGDLGARVTAIASVREEISYAGAEAAVYVAEPDLAVVVDVTHATDDPGRAGTGGRRLGSGPAVTRGSSTSAVLNERLLAVAEDAGIAHTIEAEGTRTMSDADAVHRARAGVPTALVSIPLRSMHSPSETVDLADADATAELIARFCRSLRPDERWTP